MMVWWCIYCESVLVSLTVTVALVLTMELWEALSAVLSSYNCSQMSVVSETHVLNETGRSIIDLDGSVVDPDLWLRYRILAEPSTNKDDQNDTQLRSKHQN